MKHLDNITDTEKEILSYNSYHLDNPIKLNGWQMVYKEPETNNGFEGQIYQKGNNIVVVYKGTNDKKDIFGYTNPLTGSNHIYTLLRLALNGNASN